jgi:hypothetical protein
MTAFSPAILTPEQERDLLRAKVAALESDRVQHGLEAEALRALGNLNEAEAGELRALERATERLDARLAVHRARLDELD